VEEKKRQLLRNDAATQQGFIPKVLLNMMNENGKVSRSHGLPLSILNQQAQKWDCLWKEFRQLGVIMKSNLLQF
jgi:hypothetical protein